MMVPSTGDGICVVVKIAFSWLAVEDRRVELVVKGCPPAGLTVTGFRVQPAPRKQIRRTVKSKSDSQDDVAMSSLWNIEADVDVRERKLDVAKVVFCGTASFAFEKLSNFVWLISVYQ